MGKDLIQKQVNAPAQMQQAAKKSINQMLSGILDGENMRKRFEELLGKRTPQFLSSMTTLINADVNLQKAFYEAPMTVIQSCLKAASFDLPIDPALGYAYIVPFNNSKKEADGSWTKRTEATFILGWKGMHQLAIRTGVYRAINVIDVREGELKSYNRLTEEAEIDFVEDEEEREKLPVVGYIGCYRLINGFEKTVYMSVQQIEAHEKRFRKGQYQSKGWRDDFGSMAMKTVYRKLIGKWGVMSLEYRQSEKLDEALTVEGRRYDADGTVLPEGPDEYIELDPADVAGIDFPQADATTGEVLDAVEEY